MTARRIRPAGCRVAIALLLAGTAIVIAAPIAGADSGRPTNYRSTITSIDPHPAGVSVDIVANDAFVEVTAERGTSVDIPGYEGEPYLRIRPDGTVQENRRSTSYFLNQTMTGTDAGPAGVDPTSPPDWTTVGTDGTVSWHDHRTHWMGGDPPALGPDGLVQEWSLPLTVDGAEVTVNGTLSFVDDVFPWGVVVAVAVAVGVWFASRRDTTRRGLVAPLMTGLAAVVAVGLWLAERSVAPPDAQPTVIPLVLALAALAAAVVALVRPAWRMTALAAAVALLAGWAVVRLTVWWKPLLPTAAPDWVDRGGTALVVGVGIGVAVSLLQRPAGTRSSVGAPGAASSSEPA